MVKKCIVQVTKRHNKYFRFYIGPPPKCIKSNFLIETAKCSIKQLNVYNYFSLLVCDSSFWLSITSLAFARGT